MSRVRAVLAVVFLGSVAMLPASARAQDASADGEPTLRANAYSPYEQAAIDAALTERHEAREPAPEGKLVEGIDIVTLDVIEPRDPAPSFINIFHATTRPYVVDREILARPGERYSQSQVDQSVRNLRQQLQLSLVIAVAVKGSAPGRVRLLVITKDVWSLRLNSNFEISPGGLEDLVLQPSEINFLGTHNAASLYFELDPATTTWGASYTAPRLGGTWVSLAANANVIFNRDTGNAEGSTGSLLAYQPLYSPRTEWAWDSSVSWDQEIDRRFVNAELAYFQGGPLRQDLVPWQYAQRSYTAQESVTRSFGGTLKNDFSVGAYANLLQYRVDATAPYAPYAVALFTTQEVPRSDDRVGPFVQWHLYSTKYARMLNHETLGLQEDYRLGPQVYARVYPVAKAFGSSRDFLGTYAAAGYTIPIGDGIARAVAESTVEAQSTLISDAQVDGEVQVVSPQLGFGRVVFDTYAQSRYRNYMNLLTFLGGNANLRGYPTNYFVGKDMVTGNLEVRSAPLEILHTLELGLAGFYDVGDAFNGYANLHLYQSVGAGVRALFPQLDRAVLRLDFGFPVGAGASLPGVAPMGFFIAFAQAFGMPELTQVALPSGPN